MSRKLVKGNWMLWVADFGMEKPDKFPIFKAK